MTKFRTGKTHPLQIAVVRSDPAYGRIGITFCPGKYDPNAATGAWDRELDADLDAIASWGAHLVVTLVERKELKLLRVSDLGSAVQTRGMRWLHLPIRDGGVPSATFEKNWQTHGAQIRSLLRDGYDVLVHCRGGLGRAGMIAARLLAELGVPAEDAILSVRSVRKGAIETIAQEDFVRQGHPLSQVTDAEAPHGLV